MPPRAAAKPAAKKKPAAHKLPDPIREGEILRDITKRQWRLGRSIGVVALERFMQVTSNLLWESHPKIIPSIQLYLNAWKAWKPC